MYASIVNKWRIPNPAGRRAWSRKTHGVLARSQTFFSLLTLNEDDAQTMWEDAQFYWVLLSSELRASVSRVYPAWFAKVTARPRWLTGWAVNAPAAISKGPLSLKANGRAHLLHWGTIYSFVRTLDNVKRKLIRKNMWRWLIVTRYLQWFCSYELTYFWKQAQFARERVPTSCYVIDKACLLVWSLESPFKRDFGIFKATGGASDSSVQ